MTELRIEDIVIELMDIKKRLGKLEGKLENVSVPRYSEQGLKDDMVQWIKDHWNKYNEPVRNRAIAQRFGRRADNFGSYHKILSTLESEDRIASIRNLNDSYLYLPPASFKSLTSEELEGFEELGLTPKQIDSRRKQRKAMAEKKIKSYLEHKRAGEGND